MSLKRRLFEFRRVFRHQFTIFLFIAALIIGGVLFVFTYYNDATNVVKFDHPKDLLKTTGSELPGISDPDTQFRDGVLGNFENNPDFESDIVSDRPGENGKPIDTKIHSPEVNRAMSEYGFNVVASDLASLNRSIPDVRMDECKYWHYPEDLPTASVVIAFHNEGWSPLLRTLNSVLLRSPVHLLKEVVMVDDYSDKEHLQQPLKEYLMQFGDRVKLVRNKNREGLIRTRTNGALAASGDVIIFLDAHCEVNHNWLPPLLAPIRHNRRIMTVPVIDGIDMNTWEYHRVYGEADRHFRGIFEWGLLYKEIEIPEQEKSERVYNSQPFRSPTHAGGLFAIDKQWFAELGYYDAGLQIWGGEQYELSFKVWQCGGGILFVPCSHVGHVYRNHMPYNFGKLSGKPVISTNFVRVIKTWMDEYGKYYYIRQPQAKKHEPGDISEQQKVRERLNCKSFDWYMKNVAYDVFKSYPLLPENDVWGEAKNEATGKCIDALGNTVSGTIGASQCHGYGGNQLLRLNKLGQLAHGEWCVTPTHGRLKTGPCVKGTVDGLFTYDRSTEQIRLANPDSEVIKCLTVDPNPSSTTLTITACDADMKYQKFVWTEKYV